MASWALVLLSGVWGDDVLTDARVMQPRCKGNLGPLHRLSPTLPRLDGFDARDARQKSAPYFYRNIHSLFSRTRVGYLDHCIPCIIPCSPCGSGRKPMQGWSWTLASPLHHPCIRSPATPGSSSSSRLRVVPSSVRAIPSQRHGPFPRSGRYSSSFGKSCVRLRLSSR
jgi:hypothetical protein